MQYLVQSLWFSGCYLTVLSLLVVECDAIADSAIAFSCRAARADNEVTDITAAVARVALFPAVRAVVARKHQLRQLKYAAMLIRMGCELRMFVADNETEIVNCGIALLSLMLPNKIKVSTAKEKKQRAKILLYATESLLFCCKLSKTLPAMLKEISQEGTAVQADFSFLGKVVLPLYEAELTAAPTASSTRRLSDFIIAICEFTDQVTQQYQVIASLPDYIKAQLVRLLPSVLKGRH